MRLTNETLLRQDGVVQVALTRGQVALVDAKDWERIKGYKWSSTWGRTSPTFYTQTCLSKQQGKQKTAQMHRLILNAPAHLEVHHVNGNGIDNRRCNLQLCTHAQNQASSRKRKECLSQYKGVCTANKKGRWRATITVNQKFTHLGTFDTEAEAALAYNDAALKHFGEFANLNEVNYAKG